MATDWTSPKTSDTHTNELAATRGRDESNARMDYTGDTNIPDGTIRWNKTNNRFEIWNATTSTWSVLSSKYLINVDTVDGYHAGNASGNVPVSNGTVNTNLNADKLDGQHGTFFQARANHTGTQAPSTISPQGAGSGLDADKLDGKHASEFVYTTGGTMTGDLTVPTVNGDISVADTRDQTINPEDINNRVTVDFKSGSTIGLPSLYYLVWTMRPWIDDSGGPAHQIANGSDGMFYRSGTEASGWGAWYKIWHAGNDGSGSGLDADTLDGFHASAFALAGHTTHIGEQLSPQQNGYFKMANGLILQWGRALCNKGNNTSDVNILFPITFPTACLAISTTFDNRPNDVWGALTTTAQNITKQGCSLSGDTTQEDQKIFNDVYIYYIAIGY